MRANNHRFDGIILEAKLFDTIFDLTLGLTRGGGGEGGGGGGGGVVDANPQGFSEFFPKR